jgi:3-oxoacyl-[acyl-carrier protein] reductase
MVIEAVGLEALKGQMARMTMLRRMPAFAQVADAIAVLASHRAGAMTGSIVNVTSALVAG